MFYEAERIIRKQQNYEKSRAYDVISSLRAKNLSNKETLACIEVMSNTAHNNETEKEVLILAHKIITFHIDQENLDDEVSVESNSISVGCVSKYNSSSN